MSPERKRTRKSTPAKIATTERRADALKRRKAGETFEQIAAAHGTSKSTAFDDVQIAMRETLQEPADELRRIELERLDALFNALHPTAMDTGNKAQPRAVEMCLSIMDRRSKLLGLDAPSRRIVDVFTEDGVDRAIKMLEAELAENDHRGEPGEAGATEGVARAAS